ncbi:substrate-binding domain-containing protein [Rhizobacter sp. LjRoot28]|jgi:tungstate transport system substrate-binding protein|uniref:substrate-binding domain-containing protein n=1 Tax=Rhizobacter sp. LjRoot28 TaxID=3342309 RepID=UPI003ECC4C33
MNRRPLLISLLAAALPSAAQAIQKKSMADPLLLGVEQSLVDSGLASSLQRAFGRDTGLVVKLVPGSSASVLAALEQGEVDASMTNAPEIELKLEKQGLAHDRRHVASGDLLLVGPVTGKGKKAADPAGLLGERDIAAALVRLSQSGARFIAPAAGSGANLGEIALWRAARVAPAAPWYSSTPAGGNALALAASEGAYTVVERAMWLQRDRKPLAIVVEGDARMVSPVHVMRAFRVSHPAAKLFGQWVGGAQGARAAAATRGWRGPK